MSVVSESPKSIGQVGRLEIQMRVDGTVLNPNFAGQGYSGRVSPLQS